MTHHFGASHILIEFLAHKKFSHGFHQCHDISIFPAISAISAISAMARILLEAGHDPFMLAGPGASPWATACSTGSIRAAKELLHRVKGLELRLG